jgi:hypothetical protein
MAGEGALSACIRTRPGFFFLFVFAFFAILLLLHVTLSHARFLSFPRLVF